MAPATAPISPGKGTAAPPRALNWIGIASVVPVLLEARYIFGLVQIVWLIWLGIVLSRTRPSEELRQRVSG